LFTNRFGNGNGFFCWRLQRLHVSKINRHNRLSSIQQPVPRSALLLVLANVTTLTGSVLDTSCALAFHASQFCSAMASKLMTGLH